VTVQLDKAGFVRAIETADALSPMGDTGAVLPMGNTVPSRETLIVRQTCVKAAAEFAASRPDIKSSDVLRIAESWEAWITR